MRILPFLLCLLAFPAGAQNQPSAPYMLAQDSAPRGSAAERQAETPDVPPGSPYYVGSAAEVNVSVRDFLSARLDQLRTEVLNLIALQEKQQRDLIDERDRQYAQRFQAQQEALQAALQAAEKAVANALSAAKEAVIKAETASDKRFESVNEFRDQLRDQADDFMSKEAAEARFKALESIAASNIGRLDAIKDRGEGASSTWALIIGGVGFLVGIGGFLMNYQRSRGAAA